MALIVSSLPGAAGGVAPWPRRRAGRFHLAIDPTGPLGADIKADKHPLFVRHVADQPTKRRREPLDQRGAAMIWSPLASGRFL